MNIREAAIDKENHVEIKKAIAQQNELIEKAFAAVADGILKLGKIGISNINYDVVEHFAAWSSSVRDLASFAELAKWWEHPALGATGEAQMPSLGNALSMRTLSLFLGKIYDRNRLAAYTKKGDSWWRCVPYEGQVVHAALDAEDPKPIPGVGFEVCRRAGVTGYAVKMWSETLYVPWDLGGKRIWLVVDRTTLPGEMQMRVDRFRARQWP